MNEVLLAKILLGMFTLFNLVVGYRIFLKGINSDQNKGISLMMIGIISFILLLVALAL